MSRRSCGECARAAALTVEAYDRTNSAKLADGKLLTLDNEIDTTTGTVKLRAQFDNADGVLFPNQFVNIQLLQELLAQSGHHAELGGAPRRPNGVVTTFVYLVNRRPHRVGAPGHARRRRRRARRGALRASPPARSWSPKAAIGCATARRCMLPEARLRRRPRVRRAARALVRTAAAPKDPHRPQHRTSPHAAVNPSRIFILRPVATTLLMVAILIVGAIAYKQLPLSALPEVAYPTIQVQTFYPGASPEVITSAITAPLEKQFGQMPGLNQMSSTSSGGASVITLQFTLALAIDVAEQEVQAAISAAQNLLPQDLPAPPIYAKVNPADAPVLILGITSKVMPLTEVEDLADTRIAQKISQLKGVGVVSISGGQRPAVRVVVNPRAAGRLWPEPRRPAHHHQQRQSERAEGHARRPDAAPTRSTPTIRSATPRTTAASSSPTRTARRCGCAMSPRWWRARRTPSSAAG